MNFSRRLAAVLPCVCMVLLLANCDRVNEKSDLSTDAMFPLRIKDSTIVIKPDAKRAELVAELKRTIGEEPSLETAERLQFDFIAAEGVGPLTLIIDRNAENEISQVVLEASMEEQNPVARDLKQWLRDNYGEPEPEGGSLTWKNAGWKFWFTEGGDGEDSVYGFQIFRN